MFSFGSNSLDKYAELHLDLQIIMDESIKIFDFSIVEGQRDEITQNKYYFAKKSKVKYPNSKHNQEPSKAVHCIPYPAGYDVKHKYWFYMAATIMAVAYRLYEAGMVEYQLRWGGDWDRDTDLDDQSFNDYAHFELIE